MIDASGLAARLLVWSIGLFVGSPAGAGVPGDAADAGTVSGEAVLDSAVAAQYAELSFTNVFVVPAGPRGLEYTVEARRLEQQLVRMTGFMVRTANQDPSAFMFAGHPVTTFGQEYGIVDDVPPNMAVAVLQPKAGHGSAWQPFAITVYGRLELGARSEADGHISHLRIRTDYLTTGREGQLLDVLRPLEEREVNLQPHHPSH